MRDAALFLVLLVVGAAVGAVVTRATHPTSAPIDEAPSFVAVATPPAEPPAQPQGPRAIPVHLESSIDGGAGACAELGGRQCATVTGGEMRLVAVASGAGFHAFDLNVSWAPTSPLTQSFEVIVRVCAPACSSPEAALMSVIGTSPLRLRGEIPAATTRVDLEVAPARPGPDTTAATLRVDTQQPFQVDGAVLLASSG